MTSAAFLLNTVTGWDEPPRARHQVATALSRRGPVIFVARNRIGAPGLSRLDVDEGLTVLTPSWPLDSRIRYRCPVLNELYQEWLYPRLAGIAPRARVVNFDHTATRLARHMPGYVHFCNDDLIGNSRYSLGLVDRYHVRCERMVASRARLVFATSRYMVRKMSSYNERVHELPLGAPPVLDEPPTAPARARERRRLVLGLMSFLGRRIQIGLLNRILADPDTHLVLIGPMEKGFLELLDHRERVTWLGVLKGDDLARALRDIDIGLAPYDLSRVNRGCTPNKLWHYLAAGKPAVVTALPNIGHWRFPPGCVYMAGDEEDFLRQIARARAEDRPELARNRIDHARANSWDNRISTMLELMG